MSADEIPSFINVFNQNIQNRKHHAVEIRDLLTQCCATADGGGGLATLQEVSSADVSLMRKQLEAAVKTTSVCPANKEKRTSDDRSDKTVNVADVQEWAERVRNLQLRRSPVSGTGTNIILFDATVWEEVVPNRLSSFVSDETSFHIYDSTKQEEEEEVVTWRPQEKVFLAAVPELHANAEDESKSLEHPIVCLRRKVSQGSATNPFVLIVCSYHLQGATSPGYKKLLRLKQSENFLYSFQVAAKHIAALEFPDTTVHVLAAGDGNYNHIERKTELEYLEGSTSSNKKGMINNASPAADHSNGTATTSSSSTSPTGSIVPAAVTKGSPLQFCLYRAPGASPSDPWKAVLGEDEQLYPSLFPEMGVFSFALSTLTAPSATTTVEIKPSAKKIADIFDLCQPGNRGDEYVCKSNHTDFVKCISLGQLLSRSELAFTDGTDALKFSAPWKEESAGEIAALLPKVILGSKYNDPAAKAALVITVAQFDEQKQCTTIKVQLTGGKNADIERRRDANAFCKLWKHAGKPRFSSCGVTSRLLSFRRDIATAAVVFHSSDTVLRSDHFPCRMEVRRFKEEGDEEKKVVKEKDRSNNQVLTLLDPDHWGPNARETVNALYSCCTQCGSPYMSDCKAKKDHEKKCKKENVFAFVGVKPDKNSSSEDEAPVATTSPVAKAAKSEEPLIAKSDEPPVAKPAKSVDSSSNVEPPAAKDEPTCEWCGATFKTQSILLRHKGEKDRPRAKKCIEEQERREQQGPTGAQ